MNSLEGFIKIAREFLPAIMVKAEGLPDMPVEHMSNMEEVSQTPEYRGKLRGYNLRNTIGAIKNNPEAFAASGVSNIKNDLEADRRAVIDRAFAMNAEALQKKEAALNLLKLSKKKFIQPETPPTVNELIVDDLAKYDDPDPTLAEVGGIPVTTEEALPNQWKKSEDERMYVDQPKRYANAIIRTALETSGLERNVAREATRGLNLVTLNVIRDIKRAREEARRNSPEILAEEIPARYRAVIQ